jgi:hypothetical protein
MSITIRGRGARRALVAAGALSALAAATACSDFLDPKPNDVLAPENFYASAQDAVTAVNAVYAQSVWFYFWNFYQSDVASDDVIATSNFGTDGHQLANYTLDASLWSLDDNWSNAYLTIFRANIALDRIPDIVMDEAEKARVLGEAHFLRGLMYFNLVRMFGGVPLILHELTSVAEAQTPQATADEVYAQIIEDLEAAKAGLPAAYTASADVGRATAGAAQALLAKVYLTQQNYARAAEEAGAVITGGRYALNADFKDNFRIARELTNPESIFEINYGSPDQAAGVVGSVHTLFTLPSGFPGGDAYGLMEVNPQLLALYAPDDRRGNHATFMQQTWQHRASGDSIRAYVTARGDTVQWGVPGGAAFAKWIDETNTQNMTARAWQSQPNNWIVLRYADVLLMYAEAVAQGGTATAGSAESALNAVRDRAGIGSVSGLAGPALLDSIRVERRREFAMEGQRWFDLSRWGVLDATVRAKTAFVSTYRPGETDVHGTPGGSNLFPIPQTQLNTNSQLTQNPGW